MLLTAMFMVLAAIGLSSTSARRNQMIADFQIKEQEETIKTLLRLKSDSYSQILLDYACYDDLITFLRIKDSLWSKINITVVPSYKLQLCRIFNLKHEVLFEDKDSLLKHEFRLPEEVFRLLDKNKTVDYFTETQDGLLQICACTINKSDDLERKNKHYGYFLIVRLWTKDYLHKLEKLSEARMSLQSLQSDSLSNYPIVLPLKSFNHKDAAYLCVKKDNPLLKNINRLGIYSLVLVILLSVVVLVTFFFSFRYLILTPLKKIILALDNYDPRELSFLNSKTDEFGKIAKLINDFFIQQSQLYAEIEERKQIQEELGSVNDELMAQNDEIAAQRTEIAKQRDIIALENKKFTDSINAALRIQEALTPPTEVLNMATPSNFIFSRPRDVVSGDFYWLRLARNYLYGAVGDCTGHGVPGAVMSVLGIALLNEITSHGRLDSPADVLNSLRKRLIKTLHQKSVRNFSNEGMDIILCRFDLERNILEYAGAYNPLFITRLKEGQGNGERELIELKADPMPVGVHPKDSLPFTNRVMDLKLSDRLYLTTDGFKTQFGGEKDQKFSCKRFKDLVLSIQDRPMPEQREIMVKAFEQWQGNRPQVDDVLVIGIEITRIGA